MTERSVALTGSSINQHSALCCCSHAIVRDPWTRLDCAVAIRPDFPSASGLVLWDEQKMSVSGLKAELKFLESIFDPNHERFRIIDWKPDELSCQFNVTGEKLLIIHCNITVSPGRRCAQANSLCLATEARSVRKVPCLQINYERSVRRWHRFMFSRLYSGNRRIGVK